jgi:hypothetical protein
MHWAKQAGESKLDWSILDVDQEEWERRLAELHVAAANGLRAYQPAAAVGPAAARTAIVPSAHGVRRVLPALALLTVLLGVAAGVAAYSVWRTAQTGIVRMESDVANAVRLEGVHARAEHGMLELHESVQAVEFLDNAALATVIITRTEGSELRVEPELRFYVQTAKGWQRSAPIAGFWGPTETLDTAHLHFVFSHRDEAVVAAAAPGAEAMYVLLHRATGVALTPGDLAPIEIVPESFVSTKQLGDGPLRLTSPSLYKVPAEERVALLGWQLRLAVAKQLTATAAQRSPAKAQWQPLVQALDSWSEFSTAIGFAPNGEAAALYRLALRPLSHAWHLADLQDDVLRYDPAAQGMVVYTLASEGEWQRQRETAAVQFIGYIAEHYGIDVLPRLRQGFTQYENWEELAPAVLGVSAAELEEAWHAGS